jgi:magnesium chelatase family protein
LDRIDIHIQVPRVDYEKLSDDRFGESSSSIRERVEAARMVQRDRFNAIERSKKNHRIFCNAEMGNADIRKFCKLDEGCSSLMRAAMNQYHLSARAYHRVLKLARTIADLADADKISTTHLAEALQYRPQVI